MPLCSRLISLDKHNLTESYEEHRVSEMELSICPLSLLLNGWIQGDQNLFRGSRNHALYCRVKLVCISTVVR